MDKKFLKENNLMESYKRYRQILEYTTAGGSYSIDEDDIEEPEMGADPAMGGGADPSMGGAPTDPAMGGGADPSMGGAPTDPAMGGGADPSMGGGVQGLNPQVDSQMDGGLGATQETDPNAEEEEVIDVDDLTHSQEETEKKVDALSDKFERLMGMLDSFESQIDSSNERMESLRAEIEKRNPTPVKKMSLRAKNSYPFNISPDEYWADKQATSNYSPDDDNNGVDDPQYQITKSDIDNFSDWQSIAKTMDDDNLTLKDMLNL